MQSSTLHALVNRMADKVGMGRSITAQTKPLVDQLEVLVNQFTFRTVLVALGMVAYRFATLESREGRLLTSDSWVTLGRRLILESDPSYRLEESATRQAR